jgi:hypothetical protein
MKRLNRRNDIRFRTILPISYSGLEVNQWLKESISDCNESGACILTETHFYEGHRIDVKQFGEKGKTLSTVIWCRQADYKNDPKPVFKVGLHYIK